MKKGILLVAVLFAVAGLMGAFAYTSATVSSPAKAEITSTNAALLALIPNEEYSQFVSVNKGKLNLDFTGGDYGFQPGSSYTFENLFTIKNNLDAPIKVGMRFSSVYQGDDWIPGLWRVEANRPMDGMPDNDDQYPYAFMRGQSAGSVFSSGWNEGRYLILEPGEEVPVTWMFSVEGPFPCERMQTLQVHAERLDAPNNGTDV